MTYLIIGSPCSGKSRYISEHMQKDDLVCDVDLIYSAISNQDYHDADLHIHEIALKLKSSLLDIIKNRDGEWKDAYVVSIANTREKVKKAIERINADQCIYINTPYDICMKRAQERPFYFQYLVDEWFSTKEDIENDMVCVNGFPEIDVKEESK